MNKQPEDNHRDIDNRDIDNRDTELTRLLREYQEELRTQTPATSVLDRLKEENRRRPQVVPIARRRLSSRNLWAGLAVAASLLLTVGIYRRSTQQPAPIQIAAVKLPADAPLEEKAPAQPVAELDSMGPQPARTPAKPPIDPSVPPSIRAALDTEAAHPAPPAPVPAPEAKAKAETSTAEKATNKPVMADASALAAGSASAHTPAHTPAHTVLSAVVLREVWEPGQTTRVFSGSYERSADGREVRSPLSPGDFLAMSQNSLQPHQQTLPAPASPQQQLPPPRPAASAARKAPAPARDQMAESRDRIASPQTVTLGEGIIEGYRCAGVRTTENQREGQRIVERWHSAELGLDLMVRTTEPNGSIVVVRFTNIQRRQ